MSDFFIPFAFGQRAFEHLTFFSGKFYKLKAQFYYILKLFEGN